MLQGSCGFLHARTRKRNLSRSLPDSASYKLTAHDSPIKIPLITFVYRSAGNWLFCNRRWLDRADPADRARLDSGYDALCHSFPAFLASCPRDVFMGHLSAVSEAWIATIKKNWERRSLQAAQSALSSSKEKLPSFLSSPQSSPESMMIPGIQESSHPASLTYWSPSQPRLALYCEPSPPPRHALGTLPSQTALPPVPLSPQPSAFSRVDHGALPMRRTLGGGRRTSCAADHSRSPLSPRRRQIGQSSAPAPDQGRCLEDMEEDEQHDDDDYDERQEESEEEGTVFRGIGAPRPAGRPGRISGPGRGAPAGGPAEDLVPAMAEDGRPFGRRVHAMSIERLLCHSESPPPAPPPAEAGGGGRGRGEPEGDNEARPASPGALSASGAGDGFTPPSAASPERELPPALGGAMMSAALSARALGGAALGPAAAASMAGTGLGCAPGTADSDMRNSDPPPAPLWAGHVVAPSPWLALFPRPRLAGAAAAAAAETVAACRPPCRPLFEPVRPAPTWGLGWPRVGGAAPARPGPSDVRTRF